MQKNAKQRVRVTNGDTEVLEKQRLRLWILRILIELDGNSKFLMKWGFESHSIAKLLGLEEFIDGEYDPSLARNRIHQIYREEKIRNKGSGLPRCSEIARNLNKIAKDFGLNRIEVDILHFTVQIKLNSILAEAIDMFGQTRNSLLYKLYAACLNRDITEVLTALKHNARLIKTGLLNIDPTQCFSFEGKVELLPGLIEELDLPGKNPIDVFKSSFFQSEPPILQMEDFSHISDDIKIMQHYLESAYKEKKTGVNLLIYGPPGVGKTELARLIAMLSGSTLYEIGFATSSGLPLKGEQRFRAYRTAQNLLSNHEGHLILFDEIEDVFTPSEDQKINTANHSGCKAWVNKILEENPIPALWLTNDLSCIDNAYIRRFDYVLGVKAPPKQIRKRMLDNYLVGAPVSESCKAQLAQHEHLVPATVAKASAILLSISSHNQSDNADEQLGRIIGNSLEAMGMRRPLIGGHHLDLSYSIESLAADCNIRRVCEAVTQKGQGKICLYGPPGTGKSALGRYIAEEANKPLLLKRASDILSPYLGVSETNMANMFNEAKQQQAVLVLDEADTYLQDRKNLQRSWELSSVNEMLTQIEAYEGIFICSTNLIDNLDPAALRRFDFKIKLDHLSRSQAIELFAQCATKLGFSWNSEDEERVSSLHALALGDFSTVLRQSAFLPIKDSRDFYERLKAECLMKPEGKSRSIGFH